MSENTTKPNSAKSVQKLKLSELAEGSTPGQPLFADGLKAIKDIKVPITVAVGTAEMTVQTLHELKNGDIIPLDKLTTDSVDILVDGKVIARGDLVAVDDNFGVRVTEIIGA